ncbi:MAG TPA: cytochrome c oxidase subunit II [Pilimelia sp.]|nr:cytochrome c oxidase subunit II [Pilimelia sp.]
MIAKRARVGERAGGPGVARLAGLGLGAVTLLALLTGCDVGETFAGFGWPQEGITTEAHQMYDLWIGSTVAALIVGFITWGLMFWCMIRYRKRGEDLPPQTRYNIPMETIYTATPFLIIAVLFYYTAIVQSRVDRLSPNPDVVVEVVAFKWNWQFNYRDGKGAEARTVASTLGDSDYIPVLVVPTNKTVRFEETSRDVIHSFWVPELLYKRDVFPGSIRNTFEATVEREGAYVGRCAELCGTYHSMMNFELRAVSPEKFDRFLAAMKDGRSTPEALTSVGEAPYATTTVPFETKRQMKEQVAAR